MSAVRHGPPVDERTLDVVPDAALDGAVAAPAPAAIVVPAGRGDLGERAGAYALAVSVLAAVIVLGWLAAGALGRGTAPPPRPHLVSAGRLGLVVDGTWRPTAAPPALAGLGLRDMRTFGTLLGAPTWAWTAHAPVSNPTLLPAALRAAVAQPLPRPRRVSLAGRPAWAYRGLSLAGGTALDVVVVPTTHGSVLVGCAAPFTWWASAAGCEHGVHSIAGARALRPSSDLAARRGMPRIVRTLARARRAEARAVRRAHHPRGRARAARRLAAADRGAARRLARLLPAHRRASLRALRRTAGAYAAVAGAAQHRHARRYRRATARAARADAALRRSLRRLRA